ncbi:MAG: hypothetical protein KBH15_06210, partial [Candidatus Atribacteria bacterium]|nr:hypothetical protein [Candidatus Atribacteria bacterium]
DPLSPPKTTNIKTTGRGKITEEEKTFLSGFPIKAKRSGMTKEASSLYNLPERQNKENKYNPEGKDLRVCHS